MTNSRINEYVETWKKRGYPDDIPDEVPNELMRQGLAPSYKAIAIAILKNDLKLESLGFSGSKSEWYGVFKRIELGLKTEPARQLRLFT